MKYLYGIVLGIVFGSFFILADTAGVNIILRNVGFIAFMFVSASLLITPLANITKVQSLRPYRKVFGVLGFFFALAHTGKYFYDESVYNNGKIFIAEHFAAGDVITGIIALSIIIILGVTSWNYLHKVLGKYWQYIHSLVFPLYCIIGLHIAFASRFDVKYMFVISGVVLIRVFATQLKNSGESHSQSGKYICVPCGYIYDPKKGDPDGGIAPGTSFDDIPDTWVCPECGVSKSDFIPYDEQENILAEQAKVVSVELLNDTTMELHIQLKKAPQVLPGQFAKIILTDKDGDFSRSYSVVHRQNDILVFCIKLSGGRSHAALTKLQTGDSIGFGGIFGKFILQNTKNPKVFIATGTGLAPIMHMLEQADSKTPKVLFFGVSTHKELFYEDKIGKIGGLEKNIYVSREEVAGYNFGRISLDGRNFSPETEFYICGNPTMVETNMKFLQSKNFQHIYTEQFA